jgi:hypothetical protein
VGLSFLCASGDLHPTVTCVPTAGEGGFRVVLPAMSLITQV